MGISTRSTEWLLGRLQYLKEKLRAYETIVRTVRALQLENRENLAFVEAAEAVVRFAASQMQFVATALNLVEAELSKREAKAREGAKAG
ncbi:MAG: hypothetical protein QXG57_07325 [Thermofilaceae archaeon]